MKRSVMGAVGVAMLVGLGAACSSSDDTESEPQAKDDAASEVTSSSSSGDLTPDAPAPLEPDAPEVCAEPRPLNHVPYSSCDDLPLTADDALVYDRFDGNATFDGGEVLVGHYELIKAEVDVDTSERVGRALAFDGMGGVLLNTVDRLPDAPMTQAYGIGQYTTQGSTLSLNFPGTAGACVIAGALEFSYTAFSDGCEDYLVLGRTTNNPSVGERQYRMTYRRLRAEQP